MAIYVDAGGRCAKVLKANGFKNYLQIPNQYHGPNDVALWVKDLTDPELVKEIMRLREAERVAKQTAIKEPGK